VFVTLTRPRARTAGHGRDQDPHCGDLRRSALAHDWYTVEALFLYPVCEAHTERAFSMQAWSWAAPSSTAARASVPSRWTTSSPQSQSHTRYTLLLPLVVKLSFRGAVMLTLTSGPCRKEDRFRSLFHKSTSRPTTRSSSSTTSWVLFAAPPLCLRCARRLSLGVLAPRVLSLRHHDPSANEPDRPSWSHADRRWCACREELRGIVYPHTHLLLLSLLV
jgi:hypothetical protein